MMKPYLTVNNLSFEYPDGFKALENITFKLSKNERVAVLGPNGAGKTTFILHLNDAGQIQTEVLTYFLPFYSYLLRFYKSRHLS